MAKVTSVSHTSPGPEKRTRVVTWAHNTTQCRQNTTQHKCRQNKTNNAKLRHPLGHPHPNTPIPPEPTRYLVTRDVAQHALQCIHRALCVGADDDVDRGRPLGTLLLHRRLYPLVAGGLGVLRHTGGRGTGDRGEAFAMAGGARRKPADRSTTTAGHSTMARDKLLQQQQQPPNCTVSARGSLGLPPTTIPTTIPTHKFPLPHTPGCGQAPAPTPAP